MTHESKKDLGIITDNIFSLTNWFKIIVVLSERFVLSFVFLNDWLNYKNKFYQG